MTPLPGHDQRSRRHGPLEGNTSMYMHMRRPERRGADAWADERGWARTHDEGGHKGSNEYKQGGGQGPCHTPTGPTGTPRAVVSFSVFALEFRNFTQT